MGWNTIAAPDGSALFAGIDAGHPLLLRALLRPADARRRGRCSTAGATITVTEHGEPFAAAVESGVVAATQFHPEKSGDAGAQVLRNWLGTL